MTVRTKSKFDEFLEDVDYVVAHYNDHIHDWEPFQKEMKWVYEKWCKK